MALPPTEPPHSRAEKEYWDSVWEMQRHRRPAFREERWNGDFVIRRFDRLAVRERWLPSAGETSLIEVGCARSLWLPYFAQRWGYRVQGLDYSREGCRQAEEVLQRHKVHGTVHLGNFLDPPAGLGGHFDIVLSVGLVEHFEDRAGCIRGLAAFLKPSGRIITLIPNLCGAMGTITRVLSPSIWRRHVPTSREDLREAHATAGLRILFCEYFLPVSLGVLNFESLRPRLLRSILAGGCSLLSRGMVRILDFSDRPFTSRRFSPYLLAVATTRPSYPDPGPE